jgi:CubicO group peptidase (beta-lactamase class C family)
MLRSAPVTITLLTAPFTAQGQDSAEQQVRRRERVAAVADSIGREAIERKVLTGMVVIAVHGSDTLLARGYGSADLENDVRMTVGHVFQLASVTKQFTAAAPTMPSHRAFQHSNGSTCHQTASSL